MWRVLFLCVHSIIFVSSTMSGDRRSDHGGLSTDWVSGLPDAVLEAVLLAAAIAWPGGTHTAEALQDFTTGFIPPHWQLQIVCKNWQRVYLASEQLCGRAVFSSKERGCGTFHTWWSRLEARSSWLQRRTESLRILELQGLAIVGEAPVDSLLTGVDTVCLKGLVALRHLKLENCLLPHNLGFLAGLRTLSLENLDPSCFYARWTSSDVIRALANISSLEELQLAQEKPTNWDWATPDLWRLTRLSRLIVQQHFPISLISLPQSKTPGPTAVAMHLTSLTLCQQADTIIATTLLQQPQNIMAITTAENEIKSNLTWPAAWCPGSDGGGGLMPCLRRLKIVNFHRVSLPDEFRCMASLETVILCNVNWMEREGHLSVETLPQLPATLRDLRLPYNRITSLDGLPLGHLTQLSFVDFKDECLDEAQCVARK
jgi:hypothetical protein